MECTTRQSPFSIPFRHSCAQAIANSRSGLDGSNHASNRRPMMNSPFWKNCASTPPYGSGCWSSSHDQRE